MDIDSNHPKALCRLGEAYIATHEIDKAKEYLLKVHEILPDDAQVKKLLKQIKIKENEFNETQKRMFKGIFTS